MERRYRGTAVCIRPAVRVACYEVVGEKNSADLNGQCYPEDVQNHLIFYFMYPDSINCPGARPENVIFIMRIEHQLAILLP